jgi:hypothetical protein
MMGEIKRSGSIDHYARYLTEHSLTPSISIRVSGTDTKYNNIRGVNVSGMPSIYNNGITLRLAQIDPLPNDLGQSDDSSDDTLTCPTCKMPCISDGDGQFVCIGCGEHFSKEDLQQSQANPNSDAILPKHHIPTAKQARCKLARIAMEDSSAPEFPALQNKFSRIEN